MRKIITTITLLFAFLVAFAQPEALLKQANDLYASNNFAEAIKTYESILGQGYESGTLYFNLGNAYYKNGNITRAIINFERAKLLMPADDDVQFNIDLANQFIVDKIEPLPRPFFVKWGISILNLYTTDGWARFSLITFILCLAGAIAYFFSVSPIIKKSAFIAAIVLIVLSISTFAMAKKQKAKIENRKEAIITVPTVTVKSSPDESGTNLFVLHEGVKVKLKEELGNWVNIKLEDGNSGWVNKDTFEKI